MAIETVSGLAARGMLADPGDHFSGRYEVERKYAVRDRTEIAKRLEAEGAVAFALNNRESDIFLDWPDGRLAAAGNQQVLRRMQPSERALWFVKGPGPDECAATDMEDFGKARAMLASLGCIEIDRVDKQRDIWFLGEFHVTLDHVPALGDFVEIAIMTDEEYSLASWALRIETLAADIGLQASDLQTRSYRVMLAELARGRQD